MNFIGTSFYPAHAAHVKNSYLYRNLRVMKYAWLFVVMLFMALSCERLDLINPPGITVDIEDDTTVFAQIGDFGSAGTAELKVSQMVKSWNPDLIISVGDNNYYNGLLETIQINVSSFYGDYIYNYDAPGEYRCNGTAFKECINRFFPTPGNHDSYNRDWLTPYYNFFTLPGNEKYYSFTWGPVSFFSINTVEKNPDEQKEWLESELELSDKSFNIVFLHHRPYSSGSHGDQGFIQWDFYTMGVDIVFAGHDHIYERLEKSGEPGLVYIVNGLGGRALSSCSNPHDPSLFEGFCYGSDYGAVKGTATSDRLKLEFFAIGSPDTPVDVFEFYKE